MWKVHEDNDTILCKDIKDLSQRWRDTMFVIGRWHCQYVSCSPRCFVNDMPNTAFHRNWHILKPRLKRPRISKKIPMKKKESVWMHALGAGEPLITPGWSPSGSGNLVSDTSQFKPVGKCDRINRWCWNHRNGKRKLEPCPARDQKQI